ncbi:hypothetical protein Tco_0221553 [Tanacetum coccineum]
MKDLQHSFRNSDEYSHDPEKCGHAGLKNIRVILFSIHSDDGNPSSVNIKQHCGRGSYALSWKPCQEDSSKLNLLDHRFRRRCSNLIPTESDSSPHAHTQAAKTYYKHQDSRIEKAQVQRQRLPQL